MWGSVWRIALYDLVERAISNSDLKSMSISNLSPSTITSMYSYSPVKKNSKNFQRTETHSMQWKTEGTENKIWTQKFPSGNEMKSSNFVWYNFLSGSNKPLVFLKISKCGTCNFFGFSLKPNRPRETNYRRDKRTISPNEICRLTHRNRELVNRQWRGFCKSHLFACRSCSSQQSWQCPPIDFFHEY